MAFLTAYRTIIYLTLSLVFIFRLIIFPIHIETLNSNSIYKKDCGKCGNSGIFATIRDQLGSKIDNYFPPPEANLEKGILLGSDTFPRDFKQILITTGTIHVVVVSGFNLTLLAGLVLGLSPVLGRRPTLGLSFLVIVVYTLLTGAAAPTVRAAIMASLAFGAQALGRQKESLWLLMLTVYLMLLYDPTLVTEISFQLSTAATLGILLFGSRLANWLKFPKVLKGDLANTLAAQVLVVPIIYFHFGQVSWISPLVNVLVLWTIPISTILGFIFLGLSLLLPPVALIISWINFVFLFIFNQVVSLFQGTEVLEVPDHNWWLLLGYYLMLFGIVKTRWRRE